VRAAARRTEPQWLAAPLDAVPPDGLDLFAAAQGGERFLWENRGRGLQIAALGAAAVVESAGPGRFDVAARAARRIAAGLHDVGDLGTAPLLVGGFGFADASPDGPAWRGFAPARLVLPALLVVRAPDGVHARATLRVEPGEGASEALARLREAVERGRDALRWARPGFEPEAEPAPAFRASADAPLSRYRETVEAALRDIAAGELEKVVPARAVSLSSEAGFDPARVLERLRRAHPSCTCFAVARGDAVFLGATPELLVRLEGEQLETAAVAGSAPRGRSPGEDARRARELCESKKEQAEHAVVVRALRDALAEVCAELHVPEAPRLLALEAIQHLETPLRGRLRRPQGVLELLARLHPTPAVAGAPRAAALAWLASKEGLERGWYAGPVGFVRADGGGEFWVALRSALLRGCSARLFAGAGVVAGSRPEAELQETRLKLAALLGALVEI
jgi:isochorismate synthase